MKIKYKKLIKNYYCCVFIPIFISGISGLGLITLYGTLNNFRIFCGCAVAFCVGSLIRSLIKWEK